jgi:hypothetical protein
MKLKTIEHYGYERDLMINILKIVQRWCVTKCLMVNPLKTNVMVFTRKYKQQPTQVLRVKGKETVFTSLVKYSGALLDPKLNWKQHHTERRKKFYSSIWACRRTTGNTWGISPVDAQGSSASKYTVCISGLSANGEQGDGKGPTAKPSG